MPKTLVYSLYTRLFHALLALSFLVGYLSGDGEERWVFALHLFFGMLMLFLVVLRIPWGFFGVRFSAFSEFTFSLKALTLYFWTLFTHKPTLGHNPASSWSAVAMIALGVLVPLSGLAIWGVKDGEGWFGFLYGYSFLEDLFEELHELLANGFLLVVCLHIGGVVFEHLIHRSGIVRTMLSGEKALEGESLKLAWWQHGYGVFWILGALVFALYTGM